MKKLLVLFLFAILLLTGCGGKEAAESAEEPAEDVAATEETNNEDQYQPTTDPMIAGDKTSNRRYLKAYNEVWEVTGWYKTDGTDEKGFNHIEKDGLKIDYAVVTIDGVGTGETIAVIGEITNTTDEMISLNNFDDAITDQRERVSLKGTLYELEPNTRTKMMSYADQLDYGLPNNSLEIKKPVVWFEPEDEDNDDEETRYIFEPEDERIKFTKE